MRHIHRHANSLASDCGLIYRAGSSKTNWIAPKHLARMVHPEYFDPKISDFAPRSHLHPVRLFFVLRDIRKVGLADRPPAHVRGFGSSEGSFVFLNGHVLEARPTE